MGGRGRGRWELENEEVGEDGVERKLEEENRGGRGGGWIVYVESLLNECSI